MAEILDYKKAHKTYYQPSTNPGIIDVPEWNFIAVDGHGNPNTSDEYQLALEILYGLTYTIKMSKMNGTQPAGYFEYKVFPLEGLWWFQDQRVLAGSLSIEDKEALKWRSMICQPDFVNETVLDFAKAILAKKRPALDLSKAFLFKFHEGLCVQCMHIGPYDSEANTIASMTQYAQDQGYTEDLSETRGHHEIYLGDPRRTAPEKLKTVIRHPIRPT